MKAILLGKMILLCAMLALAPAPVLAHSALGTAVPEDGAVLEQAPPHIVLTFTKPIRMTRVRMTHDAGDAVDLDLGDQTAFATRFELQLEDMGSGLYRIEWRGLSDDGHVMRSSFAFRVQ